MSALLPTPLPLFAYGTVLEPTFLGHLLERPVEAEPASLVDFQLVELPDLPSPVICEAPGKQVAGRLFRHLSAEDYERVDAYQGVAEGLYERVEADVGSDETGSASGSTERAFVYLATDRTWKRYR